MTCFSVYNTADPAETIGVVSGVTHNRDNEAVVTLTLEHPMVHGTTYTLEAMEICRYCYGCADSEISFYFDSTISNDQASWGAIKSLIR